MYFDLDLTVSVFFIPSDIWSLARNVCLCKSVEEGLSHICFNLRFYVHFLLFSDTGMQVSGRCLLGRKGPFYPIKSIPRQLKTWWHKEHQQPCHWPSSAWSTKGLSHLKNGITVYHKNYAPVRGFKCVVVVQFDEMFSIFFRNMAIGYMIYIH